MEKGKKKKTTDRQTKTNVCDSWMIIPTDENNQKINLKE